MVIVLKTMLMLMLNILVNVNLLVIKFKIVVCMINFISTSLDKLDGLKHLIEIILIAIGHQMDCYINVLFFLMLHLQKYQTIQQKRLCPLAYIKWLLQEIRQMYKLGQLCMVSVFQVLFHGFLGVERPIKNIVEQDIS